MQKDRQKEIRRSGIRKNERRPSFSAAAQAGREQELLQQISVEEERAKELEEFATYTKTKKYAEEVAKDKLGLVYEDEIIFQETD